MRQEENTGSTLGSEINWKIVARNTVYILLALFSFLFALDLLISSFQHLGTAAAETIILATSNPFTGLFIGLLITAIIQSSSTTTSMVVALVASGSITLEGAIPIIMGANIGTTITSTIVSLGFITKKKEFRRAVAAGTYHDFFNILTVLILFPLEYYYGFLSGLSQFIATRFFNEPVGANGNDFHFLGTGLGLLVNGIVGAIDNGFILVVLSFGLLFGSILFFRKVISDLLGLHSRDGRLQRFLFKSPLKTFGLGLILTALIRSSTITTSLVVPLVAKKVVKLRDSIPFILGANIGTTITAFIAAMSNSNIAISIAIAHFLFNFIGVLIFFPIPYLKEIPINLAEALGKLTLKYRLAGFLYILLTFFFIPFSLIYFNKDSVSVHELTYVKSAAGKPNTYFTIISKTYRNQQMSSWLIYDRQGESKNSPQQMVSVYRRKNILLINNELFELNRPGFCRDGEDENGSYQMCIREIIPHLELNPSLAADSVFVFEKHYRTDPDSARQITFIGGIQNHLLKKEKRSKHNELLETEELIRITPK
jgi:solute carrier family 34 (sodium-dependent phosphate cotransporter)